MPERDTARAGLAHAVVILAAGGSRRLGTPKQLLTRDGEALVHRSLRLAQATAPGCLVLVLGAHAQEVGDAGRDIPHLAIINPDWAQGMHGSLRAASAAVTAFARVLVLGCDQPALDAGHLVALLDGATQAASGCAATVSGNGPPGVPAVVPGDWFARFDDIEADRGFGQRLRAMPPTALYRLQAPELALDIDTHAQLQSARRQGLIDP